LVFGSKLLLVKEGENFNLAVLIKKSKDKPEKVILNDHDKSK